MSTIYGIGVGPGNPEWMTLQAVRILKECDLLIFPAEKEEECYSYQIAVNAVPELQAKERKFLPFPMTRDQEKLQKAHDEIYGIVLEGVTAGKNVGLLTIGDPTVYSTCMYILHRADADGIETQIISGIPSFCAAAARLGVSLGEGKEEIHIIPSGRDVKTTLSLQGTRIYMKAGKGLVELCEVLQQAENAETYAYYAVTECGMRTEQIYYGLEQIKQAQKYLTVIIVKEKAK